MKIFFWKGGSFSSKEEDNFIYLFLLGDEIPGEEEQKLGGLTGYFLVEWGWLSRKIHGALYSKWEATEEKGNGKKGGDGPRRIGWNEQNEFLE